MITPALTGEWQYFRARSPLAGPPRQPLLIVDQHAFALDFDPTAIGEFSWPLTDHFS
jgi:hypothetical protein